MAYYLGLANKESRWIDYFGTWVLIFTNFVPISLNVSLEIVKLFQGYFMQSDTSMYDEEQDMVMRA